MCVSDILVRNFVFEIPWAPLKLEFACFCRDRQERIKNSYCKNIMYFCRQMSRETVKVPNSTKFDDLDRMYTDGSEMGRQTPFFLFKVFKNLYYLCSIEAFLC